MDAPTTNNSTSATMGVARERWAWRHKGRDQWVLLVSVMGLIQTTNNKIIR